MSDNNFPCGKCGGRAGCTGADGRDFCDECDATSCQVKGVGNPCPSCNKGRVQLAKRILNMTPCPARTCGHLMMYEYIPLTDDEVRELDLEGTCDKRVCEVDSWLCTEGIVTCEYGKWSRWFLIDSGQLKFKGQKVVLIPCESV